MNCPEKYMQFDDLWLAYLVQSQGWFRGRVHAKPNISEFVVRKNDDDFSDEDKAVRDAKNEFLEYLQQRGFGCDVKEGIHVDQNGPSPGVRLPGARHGRPPECSIVPVQYRTVQQVKK